jgi:hypothetical protein
MLVILTRLGSIQFGLVLFEGLYITLSLHDGTASPCRLSASVSHFQLGVGANNLAVWHGRVDRRDTDQCKARSRSPAQAAI